MTQLRAVAFDLDGTLIDTAGGVARALNTALDALDLPVFEVQAVRGWIGDGPDVLIARALRACELHGADLDGLAVRVRRNFDAVSLAAPFADCRIYDGIETVLAALGRRLPLAVVTNKPSDLARAMLAEAGLLGHFTGVHGADTAPMRKPSPWLLAQAADAMGLAPHALLMVGDASTDCEAARAAGCLAAWAGWGYGVLAPAFADSVWRLAAPADLLVRMTLHRAIAPKS